LFDHLQVLPTRPGPFVSRRMQCNLVIGNFGDVFDSFGAGCGCYLCAPF
jgi:hypothetical protein